MTEVNETLEQFEDNKTNVYLDPIGIPTLGVGHALGKIVNGEVKLDSSTERQVTE